MLGRLGRIDEHHLRWGEGCHLADDLASDTSGGTRDQDALPGKGVFHSLEVDLDLIPGKKVLDADLLVGRRHGGDILVPFGCPVAHEYLRIGCQNIVLEPCVVTETLDPARSDKHCVYPAPAEHGSEVLVGFVDRLSE